MVFVLWFDWLIGDDWSIWSKVVPPKINKKATKDEDDWSMEWFCKEYTDFKTDSIALRKCFDTSLNLYGKRLPR